MLRRIAVGNHLLVGGDNMDLALAHYAAGEVRRKGRATRSVAIGFALALVPHGEGTAALARRAGEAQHHRAGPRAEADRRHGFGRSRAAERQRSAARWFLSAMRRGRSARAAAGFRLSRDRPAVRVRHGRHAASGGVSAGARHGGRSRSGPTHVLFNGGVFKADALRQRLLDVLGEWFPATSRRKLLEGEHDLDHAVARGAAYYGWSKHRGGVRIRGGTARAYYVGIETAGLAVPGAPRPLRALCVVPFGMEEGTEADVPGDEIGLVVGEPAQFRFFSSSTRKQDQPGDVLSRWTPEELVGDRFARSRLARRRVAWKTTTCRSASTVAITELGVLELWCVSTIDDKRWKLEFSVREDAES